ncbi:MAG: anhydro-N-acetylmuramic acid kinase [Planctomycetota bacterium]
MNRNRLVVGCMSGTSMDGIDAALVRIAGSGLSMRAELIRGASVPLDDADTLRAFAGGAALSARQIRSLALGMGEQHRDLVANVLGDVTPDLIVVHGQTVLHEPPLSWQVVDPWPLAVSMACPVVSDLRSRSIASGGEGAPLTPLADWVMFRDTERPRAVVNLGGFANLTHLPAGHGDSATAVQRITGGDVCPCNIVLDRLARSRLGTPFDDTGREASSGTVSHEASREIVRGLGRPSGTSLGTRDEAAWIDDELASLRTPAALATACDAIGQVIAGQIPSDASVVVAGGGAKNQALVRAIGVHHGSQPMLSDNFGVPVQFREAMGFAVLGSLAQDGESVSLPRITGPTTAGRDGQWILA